MSMNFIADMYLPIVMAACLVVGYLWKNFFPTDNKWIPLILAVLGAVLGCITQGVTLEAIVAGAVTGLASTGLHQAFKQLVENAGKDGEAEDETAVDKELTGEESADDAEG